MRILIADDDPVLLFALGELLTEWGYEVVSFTDGQSAHDYLLSPDHPDLALLDWSMPGMTGLDICRALRANSDATSYYVYAIMLTGRSNHEALIEALDSGADDFVTKPFMVNELRVRLRAAQRIIKMQKLLIEQASLDPLTGAFNRRRMQSSLSSEIQRAQEHNRPLSVIAVDLDHFKIVNDTYGHSAGDIVIQETAKRIQSAMRGFDMLVRTGGEEFLTICPETTLAQADSVAQRIRLRISQEPFQLSSKVTITVTASLGVATLSGGDDPEGENVMHAADLALYKAKRLGRNRVEIAPTLNQAAQE